MKHQSWVKKKGSGIESLNASGVKSKCSVTVSNGLCNSTRGTIRRGSVHIAFSKKALWGATAAIDDFREVANGLGVETGVEGCKRRCVTADEEFDVAKELGNALVLSKRSAGWRRGWWVCGVRRSSTRRALSSSWHISLPVDWVSEI